MKMAEDTDTCTPEPLPATTSAVTAYMSIPQAVSVPETELPNCRKMSGDCVAVSIDSHYLTTDRLYLYGNSFLGEELP